MAITVLPHLAKSFNNLTIFKALKLSKADVGSSSIIKDGSVINSTPIAVLFLSPPDINFYMEEPIEILATLNRPSSFSNYSTLLSYSIFVPLSFSLAANVNASRGVKYRNNISSYITYAPIFPKFSDVSVIESFIIISPLIFTF